MEGPAVNRDLEMWVARAFIAFSMIALILIALGVLD